MYDTAWVGSLLGREILEAKSMLPITKTYMKGIPSGIPEGPFDLHAYVDGSGGSESSGGVASWATALFAIDRQGKM